MKRGGTILETVVSVVIILILFFLVTQGAWQASKGDNISEIKRANKHDDWAHREGRASKGYFHLKEYFADKSNGPLRSDKPIYRNGSVMRNEDGSIRTWGDALPWAFDENGVYKEDLFLNGE